MHEARFHHNVSSLRPNANADYFGSTELDERSNVQRKNETKVSRARNTMTHTNSSTPSLMTGARSVAAKTPNLTHEPCKHASQRQQQHHLLKLQSGGRFNTCKATENRSKTALKKSASTKRQPAQHQPSGILGMHEYNSNNPDDDQCLKTPQTSMNLQGNHSSHAALDVPPFLYKTAQQSSRRSHQLIHRAAGLQNGETTQKVNLQSLMTPVPGKENGDQFEEAGGQRDESQQLQLEELKSRLKLRTQDRLGIKGLTPVKALASQSHAIAIPQASGRNHKLNNHSHQKNNSSVIDYPI